MGSSIEDAVASLEAILRGNFPAMLAEVQAERNDGIPLPSPQVYEWEEIPGSLKATPACLLIGEGEDDVDARDMIWTATIRLYIVVTDPSKQYLTRRLYRYADALKRIVRKPFNRTLDQKVVSAKVISIRYSPTFVDRDNTHARDLNAEIQLRIAR